MKCSENARYSITQLIHQLILLIALAKTPTAKLSSSNIGLEWKLVLRLKKWNLVTAFEIILMPVKAVTYERSYYGCQEKRNAFY